MSIWPSSIPVHHGISSEFGISETVTRSLRNTDTCLTAPLLPRTALNDPTVDSISNRHQELQSIKLNALS